MKFLILSFIFTLSFTASALASTLKLPHAGHYIVTLTSVDNCSPSSFAIVPFEVGTNYQGSYLKATISPIANTDMTTTVCRNGLNVASGLVTVSKKTVLEIDLESANGIFRTSSVSVRLIK